MTASYLVDINELKRLREIEKVYFNKTEEATVLKSGSGVIPTPDDDDNTETEGNHHIIGSTSSSINHTEEDQRALTIPKEIIIQETPHVENVGTHSKETLNNEILKSSVRKRFRSKASKLLTELQKFPKDFSYDNNGLISIHNQLVPGNKY